MDTGLKNADESDLMFVEKEEELDKAKSKGEVFDKILSYKKNRQYDEFVK